MYYTYAIPFADNLTKISRLITFPPACREARTAQHNALAEETLELFETMGSWHAFIIKAEPKGHMRTLWHTHWMNRIQITMVAMILGCYGVVAIGAGDTEAIFNHALKLTDSLVLANKTRTNVGRGEDQFVTGVSTLVKMTKAEWLDFATQPPKYDASGREVRKLMSPDMYWRFFRPVGCVPPTSPY